MGLPGAELNPLFDRKILGLGLVPAFSCPESLVCFEFRDLGSIGFLLVGNNEIAVKSKRIEMFTAVNVNSVLYLTWAE